MGGQGRRWVKGKGRKKQERERKSETEGRMKEIIGTSSGC
jgi:hypothetical protein